MSAKNKCETLPRDMFNGCVSLSSVSIDGVKNLGQSAFENCGLLEVSWQGVESLGHGCFFGCKLLEKVSLPAATTLNGHDFYDCERLVEVSLPEALTIENQTFGGCASLSVLDLPKVQIFNSDLRDCIALEDLYLPELRKLSDSSHFGMPPNLKTADFPVLESLPYYNAFKGLEYLENVNIPLIREIPDYAFYGCKRLTGLNMINFTSIGNYAFYQCESLKEAYLPAVEVFSEGGRQFDGCTGLETVLLGENLKEIPNEAFNKNTSLRKVDVMGNISKLDGAFENSFCGEGSQIAFHGNVESIINRPFSFAKVENVIFHGDVAAIPGWTFRSNEFLIRMSFLGKVGGFGADAFKECPNIAEVRISDLENWLSVTCEANGNPGSTSVSKVDFYLVDGLYEELLKSLVVNNVEKIRSHAFRNSSITSLKVTGEEPVTIQNEAFRNSALENIDLSDCVVSIGDGAFAATNVEYVVIPESVTTVGQTAFQMNTNLKEIAISPNILEIPNGFLWAGESLEYLVVPEGVERINQGLLSLYGQLKFVSLPSTLKSLSTSTRSSLYQMSRDVVIYSWANVAPAARLEDFAGVEVHVTAQALQSYRNDANWSKANLIADLDDNSVTNVSDSMFEIIIPDNDVDTHAAIVHCVVDCYEMSGGDRIPVGTYEFNFDREVPECMSEGQDDIESLVQREGMRLTVDGLQSETEYEYELRGYTRNKSLVYRSNGQFSTVRTHVDSIFSDADGRTVHYFDINGIFVGCDYELLPPGIYVEVKGETVRKIVK